MVLARGQSLLKTRSTRLGRRTEEACVFCCFRQAFPRLLGTDAIPTPLRKQLKDEAKRRKLENKSKVKSLKPQDRIEGWELTVGIEIHARLNTERKLFSPAYSTNTSEPNQNVARFDSASPGAQPQFQVTSLIPAIRAALALNCQVQRKSAWDRKHYFYQDQPNGYQITQYYGRSSLRISAAITISDILQNHLP